MLLSDAKAAAFIRQNFVPVWESVRPAARVTIDFGDGRTMTRTLKGSTALYVVRPDGRVVDILPGVYTPSDFIAAASESLQMLADARTDADVVKWHRDQAQVEIGRERTRVTVGKAAVESPLLEAIGAPDLAAAPADGPSPYGEAFDRLCRQMEDMSGRPMKASRVKAEVKAEDGMDIVREDSRRNLGMPRLAVHLMLAANATLPTPQDCRPTVFKRILHIDYDDPNLGLEELRVPGTN